MTNTYSDSKNDLKEVYDIFMEIKSKSGTNDKKDILRKYRDHKNFRNTLYFLLNTYIVTGVSNKKISKKFNNYDVGIDIKSFNSLLNYVENNNTGRDIDIKVIKNFIDIFSDNDHREFIESIITKSLKIGITAKTVNSVYGKGIIPVFDVMLAESYAKKENTIKDEFYLTLKLDGSRILVINDDNGTTFFTRKGIEVVGLTQLEKEFQDLPKGIVYDGEILLKNDKNIKSADLFRETQSVIKKDGEKENLIMNIFDALPIEEFKNGISTNSYRQRRNLINSLSVKNKEFIRVTPVLYHGNDKSVIPRIMKQVTSSGEEGLMLNTYDGLYETKRSSRLLKIKEFFSDDVVVKDVYEGEGRLSGSLGYITIDYKGYTVGVGSGFDDEERKKFWEYPDSIIGKVIEVQHFGESNNSTTDDTSLRFPVYKGIRDKDVSYES